MPRNAKHTYDYEINLEGPTAPARVVRMVGRDKKVLEIGAGPGSITRHLQGAGNCRVTAMEIDTEAIEILTPFCEQVYQADLNHSSWPEVLPSAEKFDVVIAADVLEHLYDPWTTLKKMKRLLKPDGYIVTSLPHVGHNAVAACLLDENFDYRDFGLLDRTHIRFFGLKNMQSLFASAGLHISEAQFVVMPPEESEFSKQWRRLSEETRTALSQNPFGEVYQVVIKGVPKEREGVNLNLMSIPVEAHEAWGGESAFERKCKALAVRYLSPAARSRILGLARTFRIKT